jgi:hypothetical protein
MCRDLQSTSASYCKHLVFCRSRCQEWYREIETMASTTASDVLIAGVRPFDYAYRLYAYRLTDRPRAEVEFPHGPPLDWRCES